MLQLTVCCLFCVVSGVRMISLSYSRISLADIALKLQLDSPEDAEFIVAKVKPSVSLAMWLSSILMTHLVCACTSLSCRRSVTA